MIATKEASKNVTPPTRRAQATPFWDQSQNPWSVGRGTPGTLLNDAHMRNAPRHPENRANIVSRVSDDLLIVSPPSVARFTTSQQDYHHPLALSIHRQTLHPSRGLDDVGNSTEVDLLQGLRTDQFPISIIYFSRFVIGAQIAG